MSDSENEINYEEILKVFNDKNNVLQQQELDESLHIKYVEALKQYHEKRNTFVEMKEIFEMEQLQTLKAIILLSDLRSQCRKSMKILQDLNEETETLNKESKTKQNEFYDIEKMYNEKIENLSKTMNEETLKHKIQEVDSSICFSQDEIQKYKIKYAELQSMFENEMKCDDLSGIREYADEIMDETKDYERNLHTYNELKNEIANYEKLVENARKQLD